jgi:hypothetical protein
MRSSEYRDEQISESKDPMKDAIAAWLLVLTALVAATFILNSANEPRSSARLFGFG